MKLLLFGKNGQIGKFLTNKLNKNKNFFSVSSKECNFLKPEQIEKIIISFKPDVIINAAAYTDVRNAEIDKKSAIKINAHAVGYIAKLAKKVNAKLIHYSTDYVFDGKKKGSYSESDSTNPINVYGKSKLIGENKIINSGCSYIIIRTSWIISEHGKNFLLTILKLLKSKTDIYAVDNQFGYPTSAEFLAKTTLEIINRKLDFVGILNITNSGKTSWFKLASFIYKEGLQRKIINKKVSIHKIKYINSKEKLKRPENSCLNNLKLKRIYNIKPDKWQIELKKIISKL